ALKTRPPEPRKEGLGQLVLPFDPDLAWAATTYMRTPTRVLWDVYRSRADRLEPLYDELVADIKADARKLARDGDGISVEVRRVEAAVRGCAADRDRLRHRSRGARGREGQCAGGRRAGSRLATRRRRDVATGAGRRDREGARPRAGARIDPVEPAIRRAAVRG